MPPTVDDPRPPEQRIAEKLAANTDVDTMPIPNSWRVEAASVLARMVEHVVEEGAVECDCDLEGRRARALKHVLDSPTWLILASNLVSELL